MNIITQFFRKNQQEVDSYIKVLNSIISKHNVSKIYVFTDNRTNLKNLDNRISNYITRNSRVKWEEAFNFVKDNEFLNKEGCFILEPGQETNFIFNRTGIHLLSNAVYIKDIKKSIPIRRNIFEDYNFLRANIIENNSKFRIAAISHIYYEDLLDEVISKHSNLYKTDYQVDFYFTLTEGNSTIGQKEWIKKKLIENFPKCIVLELPNKGLDIGPFFKILEYIMINNLKYDYLVKTHTKKSTRTSGNYFGEIWRKTLLNILEETNLKKIDELIQNEALMISSSKWIIPLSRDSFNKNYIEKIKKELNLEGGDNFVGGTMFWVKYSLIKKYFNLENIRKYYNEMKSGYFFQLDDKEEHLTHTFERIFGIMVSNENQKIEGI